jgi:predicted flap endonuclease-1-like 5' DNA nuclease
MEALLQSLKEEYDLVLLDTPAWLSVTDAAVLAPTADGVLLVASCRQVTTSALQTAYSQLTDAKARIAGMVVNRVQRDGSHYYYGYPERPEPQHAKDDLTELAGIGPASEKALNQLGIFTFKQLAKQNPETLAMRINSSVGGSRVIRSRWVEQAQTWIAETRRGPFPSRQKIAGWARRASEEFVYRFWGGASKQPVRESTGKREDEQD